jgi:uncharacterized protein Veg
MSGRIGQVIPLRFQFQRGRRKKKEKRKIFVKLQHAILFFVPNEHDFAYFYATQQSSANILDEIKKSNYQRENIKDE